MRPMVVAASISQVRRLIPADEPFQKVLDAVAANLAGLLPVMARGAFVSRASRGRPNNFESSRPDLVGASLEDAFLAGWDAATEWLNPGTEDLHEYADEAYTEWRRTV